jgi:hypothetical protein
MKKIKLTIFILIIIAGGCTSPYYLPSVEKLDVNQYGSWIEMKSNNGVYYHGELIAIDSVDIFILTDQKMLIVQPIKTMKNFKLRYAKPKHYGWTIPVFTLSTISHGIWLGYTAPVNLLVTIAVTVSGENAYTYNNQDMTFEKLKMFARFPGGIPLNVNLDDLQYQMGN